MGDFFYVDAVKSWPGLRSKYNLLYSTTLMSTVSLFDERNNGLVGVSSASASQCLFPLTSISFNLFHSSGVLQKNLFLVESNLLLRR